MEAKWLMADIAFAKDTATAAIADHVAAAIAGKAAAHIAVPGGRSPGPVFAELAARDLDWDGSEIWLTDDRCVPAGHAASNLGLLTSHLGGAGATIVPLTQKARPPRFDLVWIGMGADGHIASLFPNMDPQPGGAPAIVRDTPDPLPPEAPFDRVSLNIAALTNADAIMLLMTGDEKKAVLDAALAGDSDLPVARLIGAATCPITIFWSPT